jgi:membrane-bound ClpP family serine protease
MEAVLVIAGIAVGLLLAELLLSTGGFLAFIGAAGLVAAGVVAFNNDENDAIGAALITSGVLSLVGFAVIGRKVLRAHREEPVRTGHEEMVGKEAEVRMPLNPVGQVFADGALWKARAEDGTEIGAGNRVRVQSVDGLTLVVKPLTPESEERS